MHQAESGGEARKAAATELTELVGRIEGTVRDIDAVQESNGKTRPLGEDSDEAFAALVQRAKERNELESENTRRELDTLTTTLTSELTGAVQDCLSLRQSKDPAEQERGLVMLEGIAAAFEKFSATVREGRLEDEARRAARA